MLKTYQRETKLLEFSRDVNTEELKTEKTVSLRNGFVVIDSLQWLLLSLKTKFTSLRPIIPENIGLSSRSS